MAFTLGSILPVRQKLARQHQIHAVAFRVGHAHDVHRKINGAHDAIAKLCRQPWCAAWQLTNCCATPGGCFARGSVNTTAPSLELAPADVMGGVDVTRVTLAAAHEPSGKKNRSQQRQTLTVDRIIVAAGLQMPNQLPLSARLAWNNGKSGVQKSGRYRALRYQNVFAW